MYDPISRHGDTLWAYDPKRIIEKLTEENNKLKQENLILKEENNSLKKLVRHCKKGGAGKQK